MLQSAVLPRITYLEDSDIASVSEIQIPILLRTLLCVLGMSVRAQ